MVLPINDRAARGDEQAKLQVLGKNIASSLVVLHRLVEKTIVTPRTKDFGTKVAPTPKEKRSDAV